MAFSLAVPPNELKIGPPISKIPPWIEPPLLFTLAGEPYQTNPLAFSAGQYLQSPAQPSARP
jgi:hypothetical protein